MAEEKSFETSSHVINNFAVLQEYRSNYGQTSVFPFTFYQDEEGRIRQQGGPGSKHDIIVDINRYPSKTGFAALSWNNNAYSGSTEVRIYWTDVNGYIYERCFSVNGGSEAIWYEGSLRGQYRAATYSSIAATSDGPRNARVYYQEGETNQIIELLRPGENTFDPFFINSRKKAGLRGTRIGADTAPLYGSGQTEIFYQLPNNKWTNEGGRTKFTPTFDSPAGAGIAVAGSSNQDKATVFTVNTDGKLVATVWVKDYLTWRSGELVDVSRKDDIWSSTQSKTYDPKSFTTTVYFKKRGDGPSDPISRIGFESLDNWSEDGQIVIGSTDA
ncbi:hypothetical protein DFH27DRAFT_569413 [Peziza echinospora]|nr:hypothetical protein DFH27DRAFT_569413 [Peziza echinospora]